MIGFDPISGGPVSGESSDVPDDLTQSSFKVITVDDTNVDADLTNFPLYIEISNDTDIGANCHYTGKNINFTDSTGTQLDFERSWFTLSGGAASGGWFVKVPTIAASGGAEIRLYYGNPEAPDNEDSTAAWDANFVGVWHAEEDPSGAAPQILDSTSKAHHLTPQGSMTAADLVPGIAGDALDLDTNDALSVLDHADFNPATSITVEIWVKHSNWASRAFPIPICKGVNAEWTMAGGDPGDTALVWRIGSGAASNTVTDPGTLTNDVWYHLVGTYDGSTLRLYKQGVEVASKTRFGTIPDGSNAVSVGKGTFGNFLAGTVDEVRISNGVARSAAWIKFTYYNLSEADREISIASSGNRRRRLLIAGAA